MTADSIVSQILGEEKQREKLYPSPSVLETLKEKQEQKEVKYG